jgi:hypothetical protein
MGGSHAMSGFMVNYASMVQYPAFSAFSTIDPRAASITGRFSPY